MFNYHMGNRGKAFVNNCIKGHTRNKSDISPSLPIRLERAQCAFYYEQEIDHDTKLRVSCQAMIDFNFWPGQPPSTQFVKWGQ